MRRFTSVLSALAIAGAMGISTGVAIAETPTAGSNCGFNANQIANGFTCMETKEVTNVSREIGGGTRCQDATKTTTTYKSYNHRGNFMEDRTVVTEPEESDWGPSYPKPADGCNHS